MATEPVVTTGPETSPPPSSSGLPPKAPYESSFAAGLHFDRMRNKLRAMKYVGDFFATQKTMNTTTASDRRYRETMHKALEKRAGEPMTASANGQADAKPLGLDDDAMQANIDCPQNTTITHHYYGSQATDGPPVTTSPSPATAPPTSATGTTAAAKGLSTLAKLGIGAALMGTGAGAGLGIPLAISGITNLISRPAASAQPQAMPTFDDTLNEIGLWPKKVR